MALTLSTLNKPVNRQVIDPSTGVMREEWELYFNQLTTHLNSAVGELGADPAPANAEYLVGASNGTLTAERVATNSTSNTFNLATPGQVAVERAALTGDVTASANSNATTIANDAVTYAKMQNVSATSRILGRKTSGAGDVEECTLSEVLDFIGSAAQGDILYRGASAWERLAAGTNGQFLQTQGAAANPQWATPASGMVLLASGTLSGAASLDLVLTSYTAYRGFKVFASLLPASDGVALQARFSTNGGSSYDAGASDYAYMEHFGTEAGGHDQAESTGAAQITITGDVGNAAREGVMFEAILIDPFNASRDTRIAVRSMSITAAGVAVHSESYGFRNTGQDTDAVRFLFSGGGNMSGPYALYGIS